MEPERAPVAPQGSEACAALARRLAENVFRAVQVRRDTLDHVIVALLAEGHVLVEDNPGVGKTALARALARSIDCHFARIQCTSDLLPADVVGTNVYDERAHSFEFRPGPVFANVVLVDEINRASPKTQSGLLECMQEGRSPWTFTRTSWPGRSSSSPRRTRSSTRAPTRCPRHRSTGSWSGSRSATRPPAPRRACSPTTRPATACSLSRRSPRRPRCSRPR